MTKTFEPDRQSCRRIPAIAIVLSFAAGIGCDCLIEVSGWYWIGLASLALVLSGISGWRKESCLGTVCLLLAVLGTGAARHHTVWFAGREDDIGLFVGQSSQPARIVGTIVQRPQLIIEDEQEAEHSWGSRERSVLIVQCHQLRDAGSWREVSGSVRVLIAALASDLQIGDEVELVGRLSRPEVPRNVGEFDFAAFLRRQGVRGLLRCRSMESVRLVHRPEDTVSRFRRGLMMARDHCDSLLKKTLTADIAPVAVALLLGSRNRMSQQQYDSFIESGTMHVLAISGLNVAILALFVSGVCRLLNLSRIITAVSVLLLVGGYTAITEAGPPVVRASLLVFLAALGWPWYRKVKASNLLAATGVGVLLWDPTDLFDAGAQLSFLAVAVILWHTARQAVQQQPSTESVVSPAESSPEATEQKLASLLAANLPQSTARRLWSVAWLATRETIQLSVWIWLFTAPLIASRFHLTSPIGMLANLPLLPVTTITLCCGYAVLMVGFVSSSIAAMLSVVLEWGLRLMLSIVSLAAAIPHGHLYLPAPATWWLIGAAACGLSLFVWNQVPLSQHWGLRGIGIWSVVGLITALWPRPEGPLRCTFMSVGHGLSVLIETPQGRTLLYDAGMMGNSRRATQVAQQTLWSRGRTGLNALVLSHADVDHINGVPNLLRTIPVSVLFASPQFVDRRQPAVQQLIQSLGDNDVPIRFVWQGDLLPIESGIRIEVLHPGAEPKRSPDNANSIVLLIEYAGRRILLTGDLEGSGLQALLQQPAVPVDVLLAPHHGSLSANTTDLDRWARPQFVVASEDGRGHLDALRSRYAAASLVMSTSELGAVTFEITRSGDLAFSSFRERRE